MKPVDVVLDTEQATTEGSITAILVHRSSLTTVTTLDGSEGSIDHSSTLFVDLSYMFEHE